MDTEVLQKSITKNNYNQNSPNAALHWLLVASGMGRTGLPAYWSPLRDAYLRQVLFTEYHDFWSGAIGIAITKMASLGFDVTGTQPRIRNYFQQLYLDADGNQSWVAFISKHLQDFLATDNGAFIEVVRATSAAGSRILGLVHLDSLRCTRTGDPETPVIYRDLMGYEHNVQAHQVLMLSDMPNPAASLHGVGFCATSRAWTSIRKMETIERYIYEKISGDRALSLDLVKGIAPQSIKNSVEYAREDRQIQNSRKAANNGDGSPEGAFLYMGSVVVPVLDDTPLAHTRIDFASLPDGFNYTEQFDKSVLQMANAIGLDVQDLQPLTGRALGTGAQSQVLDEKSKGKGLAAWRQQWMHLNNQLILPDTVTFAFSEDDTRDQKAKADVFNAEATAVKTAIEAGVISSAQGTQILADEGFIPKEFVPVDTTPQESISDDEKPTAENQAQTEAMPQTPPPDVTAKELRVQFQDALKRFHEAMREGAK